MGQGHLPWAPPLRSHLRAWEMRSPARVGAELGRGGRSRGISPRTGRPPGGPPRARFGSAGPAGDLQAPAPLFGSGGGHPQAALTLGGVLILVYFSPPLNSPKSTRARCVPPFLTKRRRLQISALSGEPGRGTSMGIPPKPFPPEAGAAGKGPGRLLGGRELFARLGSVVQGKYCLGEAGRIMAPNYGAGWLRSSDLHGTLFLSVQRGSFFTPRCLKEGFIYLLGEAWRTPAITEL